MGVPSHLDLGRCLVKAFNITQLIDKQANGNKLYLEFLRESSLSMGLYALPADSIDPQQPHTEDEVYYIISGQGMITVGDEEKSVQAGDIIFVAAGVEHRFHTIVKGLKILVFFAPAEYDLHKP